MPEYSGNSMGSGNPPGKHNSSYAKTRKDSKGHFMSDASYRGSMNVGVNASAKQVGNQPKNTSTSTLESRANKTDSIPG